jgi:hypothetical protein
MLNRWWIWEDFGVSASWGCNYYPKKTDGGLWQNGGSKRPPECRIRLVRWCPLQWLRAWLPPSPRWKPIQDLLRCMADEPWFALEQCQVQSGSAGWLISVLSQHENRHSPLQTYLSHQTKGYFWAAHLTYHGHLEVSPQNRVPPKSSNV